MRLLYFLPLLAPIHYALADGTPGNPADLDKQYRINFATKDLGGCQGYEELLRKSYGEAFVVAQTAHSRLIALAKTRPDGRVDRAGANSRALAGRTFMALFGEARDNFLEAGFAGAVRTVRDNFGRLLDDVPSNALFTIGGVPEPSIYCSTSWLKVLGPMAEDPKDTQNPKRTIAETRGPDVAGLAYSIPDDAVTRISKEFVALGDFCGPQSDNLAFTMAEFSAITFCPQTLDGTTTARPSITDEKQTIQENDRIGDHRTMAEMWVHEWIHLLVRGHDPDAVDSQGQPRVLENGATAKAYGWDDMVNLARYQPGSTQQTPDAYAIYGNAMFLDNFNWSTGKATPLPT